MKIRKIAAVMVLVFSSFAASSVAPSKAELESMYSKAFREFDGNNFSEALKQLDEIDARQPDVAESHNLRGVILMRQGSYDQAETALQEAVRIDPKFWNARFNLAEIPFLKKNWAEARDRFEKLLSSNVSDLEGEAAQLIQYKILLTYLLEGKENMVDSILAKFELTPDSPAVHYANAAIAFQHKNDEQARTWLSTAEKNFSPQLNKLFAESMYEVGWVQKPAGQARASIPLTTAAERAEKTKSFARSRFEQAQQALQQRDLDTARKFVDEADSSEPNQPATLNLRGEILMEQKQFDEAETAFKKALKIDPKFRESQYNLAQIPFKKKDYATARDRFETLLKQTPGGDKNQASQILKFKVFMTYLLEGKDSRAQKLMEQFQFTGDTPALYYAQAAWEFKHNNPNKGTDWVGSAKKIYSSALNNVFADSFYDQGWMESPSIATGVASAAEAATVMSAQTGAGPAIEPSPIPGTALASAKQLKGSKAGVASENLLESKAESQPESLVGSSPAASPFINWNERTAPEAAASPVTTAGSTVAAGTPAAPKDVPAVPEATLSPIVETTPAVTAASPGASVAALASPAAQPGQPVVAQSGPPAAEKSATPATALAPAHINSQAPPAAAGPNHMIAPRTLVIGGLLVAAMFLIAWVVVPHFRQRGAPQVPVFRQTAPAAGPRVHPSVTLAPSSEGPAVSKHLNGGPRQVSLQLKASEPSVRRAAVPSGKPLRTTNGEGPSGKPLRTTNGEAPSRQPLRIPNGESSAAESLAAPANGRAPETVAYRAPERPVETPEVIEREVGPTVGTPVGESVGPVIEQPEPALPIGSQIFEPMQALREGEGATAFVPRPIESRPEPTAVESAIESQISEPVIEPEPVAQTDVEPIGQGQPVPFQTPVWPEVSGLEPAVDTPLFERSVIEPSQSLVQQPTKPTTMPETIQIQTVPSEFLAQPPTIPATMPEPIQVPSVRPTSSPAAAPQPAGAMQTSVQLTFTFEIASMQLTPTFKMGALQVRPTSKIVAMRLAPSQQPQPGMNLQVVFEVAKIQPTGGALGSIRLTPSQQQRPTPTGTPSFAVAGLQLVPNFESAPLQLTPTGHSASILVTAPFQIATVEFSPSFEIASIALNSNSKQVLVQLPGPAPAPGDVPMFEIANLQLTGSGDIGMMQLNLLGQGARH